MTKFMVLYHAPMSAREQIANATPEQASAGMDLWMTWSEQNRDAVVDLGMPLAVRPDAGAPAHADSTVAGYSVLQAESPQALAAILADHPHLHTPGGPIEVLEFLPIPGM